MSHIIITGVPGTPPAGALPPNRREINDLVKDNIQFSLFIQALSAMFNKSQTTEVSHFQIGGIHGLPYIQWDGAGGDDPVSGSEWGGYCTHGNVIFPTWHRPYVTLYEQVLNQHAQEIAKQYTTNKDQWLKAASALRFPYWDWASNSVPPPEVISLAQVTITTPNGQKTKVDNPLFAYRFHPIDPSFGEPYNVWQTTLRHPTNSGPNATSNVKELTSDLRSVQNDVRTKTYNLLTRVHTWPAFSNHTPGDGGSSSNSLEAIHDGIHVDVGGGGHMSDPSVAGFDAIFFLHHCNVDRLLALWKALNPDVWVTRGPAIDGSWTIDANAEVDSTTALTPFWDSQSSFWASAQVADFTKLGYSYPEFNGLDLGNPAAVRVAIGEIVNRLYGGSRAHSLFNLTAQAETKDRALPEATQPAVEQTLLATPPTAHASQGSGPHIIHSNHPVGVYGQLLEWTARVQFKKFELGTSFSVLIFLGEVPDDPAHWRSSPNFIGAHNAFVNSAAHRCANCRRQADILDEGFVSLNDAIARLSGLGSFEPNVVEPYLTRELKWRVIKVDRTPVDLPDLPSLDVDVICTPLSLPPGELFPVPGEARHHHRITEGRPGGHTSS